MNQYPQIRSTSYNDFAGVEVSIPITITKWWRMNHMIRGAYKKEQTPYHGVTYAIPIDDYNLTGSQVFTLTKSFWMSPIITVPGRFQVCIFTCQATA